MENKSSFLKILSDYRNSDAVSQSLLKALAGSIGFYKKEITNYKRKVHFDTGDLFECLLCYPEEFDNLFYIMDNIPSGTAGEIVRYVYDTSFVAAESDSSVLLLDSDYFKDIILDACDTFEFGGKEWSDERKLNSIYKYKEYFNELQKTGGRTAITSLQQTTTAFLVSSVLTHRFTSALFIKDNDWDILYQAPLYAEYRGCSIKGLIDMLRINRKHTLIQPFDIKTTGSSVREFPRSGKSYRYDVQGAWYLLLLRILYPDYQILPFTFIVVSTKYNEPPLLYELSDIDINVGQWGGFYSYNYTGKRIENTLSWIQPDEGAAEVPSDILGFEQMLTLYKEHLLLNQWELDMEVFKSNGKLTLQIW